MESLFTMLRTCGDGAFAINQRQRIVLWNDACTDMLGYPAREVLGKPCYEVIGGRSDSGCLLCTSECFLQHQALKHRPVPSRDVQVTTRCGREVWLNMSTIAVPSGLRELSSVLHFIRDITVRKHIEHAVGELVHDVERLDRAVSQDTTASRVAARRGADLTRRESEVLGELGTGATTTELAERLGIRQSTARNHIHNVISKLGVRNRLEAVTVAMRDGLL